LSQRNYTKECYLYTQPCSEIQLRLGQQNKSTILPQAQVVQAACNDHLSHLLEIQLVHHCQQTIRKNYTPTMSPLQKVRIFHISNHIMVLKVMTQCSLEVGYLHLMEICCLNIHGRLHCHNTQTTIQMFYITKTSTFVL
jgi:hypothetical protein